MEFSSFIKSKIAEENEITFPIKFPSEPEGFEEEE